LSVVTDASDLPVTESESDDDSAVEEWRNTYNSKVVRFCFIRINLTKIKSPHLLLVFIRPYHVAAYRCDIYSEMKSTQSSKFLSAVTNASDLPVTDSESDNDSAVEEWCFLLKN
jgi:hypothetical protein